MEVPAELNYTADHLWVRLENDIAIIGLTDFAQDSLGEVVYVGMAEVGASVVVDQAVCEVESSKSLTDVGAPFEGTLAETNIDLFDDPSPINSDPYGDGWLFKLLLGDASHSKHGLLDHLGYIEITEGAS